MKNAISGQYGAALEMMKDSLSNCSDLVWHGSGYKIKTWRIAYHAIFYADLYASNGINDFKPWANHIEDYHALGPMIEKDGRLPVISREYSKNEVGNYLGIVRNNIAKGIQSAVLEGDSGFPWLLMNKLEVHLYNIRHLQHHIGQINDRLANNGLTGSGWIGKLG